MDKPEEPRTGGTKQQPVATIDIEKLAEKVYQLMRTDIRLARNRGNSAHVRK